MAAAEGPLSTSIDSMSSGGRSAIRLAGLSWFEALPPPAAAVTTLTPFETASLEMMSPSTT